MHEEFALERRNRHQDFAKMDQKMSDKMEEVVKSEQLARQQAQNEKMKKMPGTRCRMILPYRFGRNEEPENWKRKDRL